MTVAQVKAIVQEAGGPDHVLGIIFSDGTERYFTPERPFSLDDFVTIGGLDVYKLDTKFCNIETGTYDIDSILYVDLVFMQVIETVKDPAMLKKIDRHELVFFGNK